MEMKTTPYALLAALLLSGCASSPETAHRLAYPPTGVVPQELWSDDLKILFGETQEMKEEQSLRQHMLESGPTNAINPELAVRLRDSDQVEIFLLDPNIHVPRTNTVASFPVAPYSAYARVAEHATLPVDSVRAVVRIWTSLMLSPEGKGHVSHFPTHGIRFTEHGHVVFETTLSWNTRTFWMYENGEPRWFALPDGAPTLMAKDIFTRNFSTMIEFNPRSGEQEN
jgi:hypothetical protein